MPRHLFSSAMLFLLLCVLSACISSQAAEVASLSEPAGSFFCWKEVSAEEGTIDSLRAPVLLQVSGEPFLIAEAHCTKDNTDTVRAIVSQLITASDGAAGEALKGASVGKPQVLDKCAAAEKKIDVSRPTAVAKGNDIYMLLGNHGGALPEAGANNTGLLLVKGSVSGEKKIEWSANFLLSRTAAIEEHKSVSRLIGGGGGGVLTADGTLVFPVQATKRKTGGTTEKTVSLVLYSSDPETGTWRLSKGMSAEGCGSPSVVAWEGNKLLMMAACEDGRRRVYESDDKGETWTEALGTLSRVWGGAPAGAGPDVRSGFITATIGGSGEGRRVLLVTLPVYSGDGGNGRLHLWLTDTAHVVDAGPIATAGDEDDSAAAVAASALLLKGGTELIAVYEKRKSEEAQAARLFAAQLTAQLERVKEVVETWKAVDARVGRLCPSSAAAASGGACGLFVPTAGLVGYLAGTVTGTAWVDEYLGVNATVTGTVEVTASGVTFKGRGSWAEWPVAKGGQVQPYHFANYNFTLAATVTIHAAPKGGSIPFLGLSMSAKGGATARWGLSYNHDDEPGELCGDAAGGPDTGTCETNKKYNVAIVRQGGSQGFMYIDGVPVGGSQPEQRCGTQPCTISHFYIGGDGGGAADAAGQDSRVTVTNVLLYNRPLDADEIGALHNKTVPAAMQKEPTLQPEVPAPSEEEPSKCAGATLPATQLESEAAHLSFPGNTAPTGHGSSLGQTPDMSKEGGKGAPPRPAAAASSTVSANVSKEKSDPPAVEGARQPQPRELAASAEEETVAHTGSVSSAENEATTSKEAAPVSQGQGGVSSSDAAAPAGAAQEGSRAGATDAGGAAVHGGAARTAVRPHRQACRRRGSKGCGIRPR
ncbi:trans-sialidase, partial [Trypanosoma conorhini]